MVMTASNIDLRSKEARRKCPERQPRLIQPQYELIHPETLAVGHFSLLTSTYLSVSPYTIVSSVFGPSSLATRERPSGEESGEWVCTADDSCESLMTQSTCL